MSEIRSLYLHGLGRPELRRGERALLRHHKRSGIDVVPAQIKWESTEKFIDLLDRVTNIANERLRGLGEEGILVLEGSSAGGSLAFNVAHQIDDKRLRVISHSGRLVAGSYREGSHSSLEKCAHLGTKRASQSFYDSVTYCERITLPQMHPDDYDRYLITKPWGDEVVPTSTMTIEGIKTVLVPTLGHSPGIGLGMLWTPRLIEEHLS